jgi:Cu(I)/Ag(I) efflux system membrane protein CusA/SilA
MVSSTVLTLVVIPAVYALVKGWGLPGDPGTVEADVRGLEAGYGQAAE